ncbi:hypothetical protein D1007_23539 [Hordeum vulgare]|nr:hypothetical protein D1007_23539 [Hordeum vulgare]
MTPRTTSAAGGVAPAPDVKPCAPFSKPPNAAVAKKGKVFGRKKKAADGSSRRPKKRLAGRAKDAVATEAPASSLAVLAADAHKVVDEMPQEQEASLVTADMQLASLELDIKAIQINKEEDRKEFQEFRTMVNKNFATMQSNFDKIHGNFRRLLVEPGSDEGQVERSEQGSAQMKGHEAQSPVTPAAS